jgi:hypothetical protein
MASVGSLQGQIGRLALVFLLCFDHYSFTAEDQSPQKQEPTVEAAGEFLNNAKDLDIDKVCSALKMLTKSKGKSSKDAIVRFLGEARVINKFEAELNGKPNVYPLFPPSDKTGPDARSVGVKRIRHPLDNSDLLRIMRAIASADDEFSEEVILRSLDRAETFGALITSGSTKDHTKRDRNSVRVAALGSLCRPSDQVWGLLGKEMADMDSDYRSAARIALWDLLDSKEDAKAKRILREHIAKDFGELIGLQKRRNVPAAFELLCEGYLTWRGTNRDWDRWLFAALSEAHGGAITILSPADAPEYETAKAEDIPRFLKAIDSVLNVVEAKALPPDEKRKLEAIRAMLAKKAEGANKGKISEEPQGAKDGKPEK